MNSIESLESMYLFSHCFYNVSEYIQCLASLNIWDLDVFQKDCQRNGVKKEALSPRAWGSMNLSFGS